VRGGRPAPQIHSPRPYQSDFLLGEEPLKNDEAIPIGVRRRSGDDPRTFGFLKLAARSTPARSTPARMWNKDISCGRFVCRSRRKLLGTGEANGRLSVGAWRK